MEARSPSSATGFAAAAPPPRRSKVSIHEARVKVASTHGMHARPATQFVLLANQYASKIEVSKGNVTVDGKSVASMLTLGAELGAELRIRADGTDAPQAVQALIELVASDLDADLEKQA